MQYLDTSVLIAAHRPEDRNHVVANRFFAKLLATKTAFATSLFALSEVAGFFSRNHSPERARAIIDELLNLENMTAVYFEGSHTFQDSLLSACVLTGLSGADALHYLQALSHPDVDEFVTLDRDFRRVKNGTKVTLLTEKQ